MRLSKRFKHPNYPKFPTHLTLPEDQRPVRATAFLQSAINRSGQGNPNSQAGRSRLLKQHDCPVEYPDCSQGWCRYERKGPHWHVFTFYRGVDDKPAQAGQTGPANPGEWLSVVTRTEPMANTPEAMEAKSKELTEVAFWRAVEQERKNWFARATSTEGHIPHPRTFRMEAVRAKQIGGKYALCLKIGDALLPMSAIVDTLHEACGMWRERPDKHNVAVACCSRLDRNWQLCELNPLTKEGHPKRGGNPASGGPDKANAKEGGL